MTTFYHVAAAVVVWLRCDGRDRLLDTLPVAPLPEVLVTVGTLPDPFFGVRGVVRVLARINLCNAPVAETTAFGCCREVDRNPLLV